MSAGRIPTTANSPLTAKGDLFGYSTQPARLPVGANGETLVADSSTATGLKWAAAAATSGPTFFAYKSTPQVITTATFTKVTLPNELWDSDNCFDSTTNYRFTPTKSGYYQMTANMLTSGTPATRHMYMFYKNGNQYTRYADLQSGNQNMSGSTMMYFNGTTDYAELYVYLTGTSLLVEAGQDFTAFSGVWIRS